MLKFFVNNKQIVTLAQGSDDGNVTVQKRSLGEIEREYTISAGDMITLLNWYQFQKAMGNEHLEY